MLSIGAMGSWSAGYYTSLAREDYYLEGGEPPGRWIGEGAEALELTGTVGKDTLSFLLQGFSADGTTKLIQNAGAEDHQPGWDLTFTVPKSVSVLWANADPELRRSIQDAAWKANQKAIQYIQQEAAITRAGKGGRERLRAKLIVASFEHGTSRAGDPNLHWHNLVANVCTDEEGKTRTLLSYPFYQHKMAAGAVFRAELSAELSALGIQTERKQSWFEASHVPQALVDEHSKRRAEIEETLAKSGFDSPAAADIANLTTRTAKEQRPRADFFSEWQAVGEKFGFTAREVAMLISDIPEIDRATILDTAIEAALTKLTQHESYFLKRELVRCVAEECQATGVGAEFVLAAVDHALERSPGIVRLGMLGNEYRFTTPKVLDMEKAVLTRVEESKARRFAYASDATLGSLTSELLPKQLKPEQDAALRHITQSAGSIKVVTGFAGTGKSFLLTEARKAFEREGFEVFGVCLAGMTAERLAGDTGIKTSTVASVLYRVEKALEEDRPSPLHSKMVLIVDEAGMLGTASFEAITKACSEAGTTLIATGAADQLQPIEAGGMFARIAKELGDVELTDIVRQQPDIDPVTGEKDHWRRDAVVEFNQGKALSALTRYAEKGFVDVAATERHAMEELADVWSREGLSNPSENVIFVSTNLQATNLNRICQAKRRADQTISETSPEESIQVRSDTLYIGDRVLFSEKNKRLGIENGYRGTLTAIDQRFKTLHIERDDGKLLTVPLEQYDNIKLGYAMTTHKGQGGTFDNVYVLVGGPMQDRHISYVQGSRARLNTYFFTSKREAGDGLTKLAQNMGRERQKNLAHDMLSPNPAPKHSNDHWPTQ